MEEELEVIEIYGFATSKEVADLLHKSIRAVIRKLGKLAEWKEIEVLDFHRRRLYVRKQILNTKCNIETPQH